VIEEGRGVKSEFCCQGFAGVTDLLERARKEGNGPFSSIFYEKKAQVSSGIWL
jgi:hypothetical protein